MRYTWTIEKKDFKATSKFMMTVNQPSGDRYLSFAHIDCDGKADLVISRLHHLIEQDNSPPPWKDYFTAKLAQRQSLGQDALFFICSQVNAIHSLFEQCQDQEALNWLTEIEEDCC